MRKISISMMLVTSIQAYPVAAQPEDTGFKLAEKLCARCHAIERGKVSRHPRAPSFMEIANRYSVWGLQEALAEGIVVGHPDMPKFVLNPEEINPLLTYMDGLKSQKKPAQ